MPGPQNFDREMCRRTKSEQSDFIARLHVGYAKAAKPDNAGTQQRRGVNVVQRRRQREDEVRTSDGKLRVPTIFAITGKSRRIAKVFKVVSAVPARAVRASDPRDAYSGSQRQLRRLSFDNLPHDLMTGDQIFTQSRQFSFDDVQVGPANTARQYTQEHLARSRFRPRCVLDTQRMARAATGRMEYCGFHCEPVTL